MEDRFPLEEGTVMTDTTNNETDVVVIDDMFVDIDGNTQMQVSHHTDTPARCHNHCGSFSVTPEDIFERVDNGELE